MKPSKTKPTFIKCLKRKKNKFANVRCAISRLTIARWEFLSVATFSIVGA